MKKEKQGKQPKPDKASKAEKAEKAGKGEKAEKAEKVEKIEEPRVKHDRVPRLKIKYRDEVVPALKKQFNYDNAMQVPRVQKVVLNIGLGEAIQNPKALEAAEKDMVSISGQHPVITRSKRSISAFKLRAGMPIGMMVTLRGGRMYDFLDKLANAVLPRIRDFPGIPRKSFDGRGNYSLALKEQIIFPEIEYDKVDKIRGMEVTIVTSAKNDEEARELLALLGMPFERS
jgi:large subunit ribosomal protein L5